MNRLMVNALNVGIAAALAVGLSACNRSADAGTQGAQADASAAAAQQPRTHSRRVGIASPLRLAPPLIFPS